MIFSNFFKQRKPSKFRYTYRYYDPKKEERQKKIERSRRRLFPEDFSDNDSYKAKENIKGSFFQQSSILKEDRADKHFQSSLQGKNWTLLLIFILLLVLFLWMYNSSKWQFFSSLGF